MSHALEALRLHALGFSPIVERPNSKSPLEPAWQRLAGRSADAVREAFERAPEGHGIGTVTHGFIVVDLDVRPDYSGVESLAALPPLPPTLTSCTPSGGRHLFFRTPAGVDIRNSVSRLGKGIDIRGHGGQVVLPPTVIDGKPYLWDEGAPSVMAELPASWVEMLADSRTPPPYAPAMPAPLLRIVRSPDDLAHEADRRRAYMATLNEPSIQGSNGNAVMMRAAFHAREMSRTVEEALAALEAWNERMGSPPWPRHDLARAVARSEGVLGAGLDRPDPSAVVTFADAGGSAEAPLAAEEAAPRPNPRTSPVAWVQSMQAYVARRRDGSWDLSNPLLEKAAKLKLIATGIPAKRASKLLADGGVLFAERVDCNPDEGPTFRDGEDTVLNTYVPPRIKPSPGPFPTIDSVLTHLTCGDRAARAWLVNWLGFAVQHPARPMRTVPVFYGAQRTGKSLIARVLTTLIGEANSTVIRNEDIKSRFTSHFVNKLFVTVGEIEASEVGHATSTLKYLTGEPVLKFEAKGSNAMDVTNRIKMMCNSNQTLPVHVEGADDTRWVLFKQLDKPSEEQTKAMRSLFELGTNEWSARGLAELSGFYDHLLSLNVDAELAMSVHANAARASAVEASRSSVEQFVEAVKGTSLDAVWLAVVPEHERVTPAFNHMDLPGHAELAGVSAVYATYRSFCRASGLQALGTGRFPQELERHAPLWTRRKVATNVHVQRPTVYEGIPRQPHLRLQYVPLAARQLPFATTQSNPNTARAVGNLQTAFEGVEEVES